MRNRPFGIYCFSIIYNMLGIIGIQACIYGLQALARSNTLVIGQADLTQTLGIIITVMFFSSSFLLLKQKKLGYFIPIFLLTFFIAGGFLILLPVLIVHIIYFTKKEINEIFI